VAYLNSASKKCLKRVNVSFRSLCSEIPCEAEIQIEIIFSRLAEELRNEVTVAVVS
jgi:hypothetical protein